MLCKLRLQSSEQELREAKETLFVYLTLIILILLIIYNLT